MEPHLRRRVEVRLGTEIAHHRRAADEFEKAVDAQTIHPAIGWARLHMLELKVDVLIEECLMLLHGSALRRPLKPGVPGVDDGYCNLADALIDELVARTPVGCWSSFTVLGRVEDFSRTSRVIRVRYPGASLWDLPVVAHELGHFVGPSLVDERGLRIKHPFEILYDRLGRKDALAWRWFHELFADAFAAYVVGPAYGFTSSALGFNPLYAHVSTDTHPGASVRVRAIVSALRALDPSGFSGVSLAAEQVEKLWAGLVQASEAAPAPVGADEMDGWIPELMRLLTESLPVSGYAGWSEAERLSGSLGKDAGEMSVEARTTLADVLNAAWLVRLDAKPSKVRDIEKRARAMCGKVIREVAGEGG